MKQFLFAFILISAPLCAQMTPNTAIVWTPDTWSPPAASLIFTQAVNPADFFVTPTTQTLQCDKYQHVEHHPAHEEHGCVGSPTPVISLTAQFSWCEDIVLHIPESPDTCAENYRNVTERQWADVLSRLNRLENGSGTVTSITSGGGGSSVLATTTIGEVLWYVTSQPSDGTTSVSDNALTTACPARANTSGWSPLSEAPRDGTWVEVLNDYGVAPTYGLYHWNKSGWWETSAAISGLGGDTCMFFRPYKGDPAKYVDPTHGEQYKTEYWCRAMNRPYDAKKDVCR
jgi:hypothetical protein